ncbi:hypothetical protein [Streptomyces sp. NPDC059639]|uniref:hypothetical protein n=1 Tax=Streptomyces sp. NPDC059639 TaxID=3346891 RepID=UPI0036C6C2FD
MSPHPHPPLKSVPVPVPGKPQGATQPVDAMSVGEPKGVAEGVPTACLPGPRRNDGRFPIAWLHIVAPRGAVPTATSKCACGRDRSAVGQARVLALIDDHTAHRDLCPLRNPQEGRAAA